MIIEILTILGILMFAILVLLPFAWLALWLKTRVMRKKIPETIKKEVEYEKERRRAGGGRVYTGLKEFIEPEGDRRIRNETGSSSGTAYSIPRVGQPETGGCIPIQDASDSAGHIQKPERNWEQLD